MFPTFISILDIQSWWEVPSIAHFCSLFRTAFNLLDFDIEDLEEALLTDGTEESSWLQELIVRLLSGCLPNNEISTFNYQMFLRRLFRQKCQEHDRYNPFNTDVDFQLLPLRTKVDILHSLCDFRLDADDVLDQLKNLEADSLRVEPLGYDGKDSAYWYFYGTRLYREDFNARSNKKKSVWQVICFTEDDWFHLTKKFRKSGCKAERQLHHTLSENFLPELPRLFKEKENLARKRLLDNLPRRSSSRLKKLETETEVGKKFEKNKLEEQVKRDTENQKVCDKRANKLKEKSVESSSEASDDRSGMAGAKAKKSKTRQRKLSDSSISSRDDLPTKKNKRHKKDKTDSARTSKVDLKNLQLKPTAVGRQTNNSLSAATGQILIQPITNPKKKKLKTSQVFRQTEEDVQTGMHKILDFVKNHEDAWPFADPVEEEYAPNYYTIIRKPMDLQRMEERLESGYYKTFFKFRSDFKLIVDNCRLYNGAENEYTEMVDNLLQVFDKATEKYLDPILSSDDEIAVEFLETDLGKENTSSKKKKLEVEAATSKRKPTLAAQTDKKMNRSLSEESRRSFKSLDKIFVEPTVKKSEKSRKSAKKKSKTKLKKEKSERHEKSGKISQQSIDTKKDSENKKDMDIKKVVISKKSKIEKDSKEKKKSKWMNEQVAEKHKSGGKCKKSSKKEKRASPARARNKARSPSPALKSDFSSPPPSWPPSSPESTFDVLPEHKSKEMSKSDEDILKTKQKVYKKFRNFFGEDEPNQLIPLSSQPKDKHNKLRETIEKLKAKSDLAKITNEYDFKLVDHPKENKKEKQPARKQDKDYKLKKEAKEGRDCAASPFEGNSTLDSFHSEGNGKKSKKASLIKSGTFYKNSSTMDALSIATEQTLKDINKWLDDTPKFSEFSSASNSPSYTGFGDEFDSMANKTEHISNKKNEKSKKEAKDPKRKSFRDPSKFFKKRELQRTIDRLQPGKSKGNLISTVQTIKTTEEIFPLGTLSKIKDTKNSLIVKTGMNAPKLSLGTVLDSFGKHKFIDDQKKEKEAETALVETPKEKVETKTNTVTEEVDKTIEEENTIKIGTKPNKIDVTEVKIDSKEKETNVVEDSSGGGATPNLSAWFKAFGAPKTQISQKKLENKPDGKDGDESAVKTDNLDNRNKAESEASAEGAQIGPAIFQLIPRQRKISTGSSVSERSSFSQDMDSPRVGMEERGAYPAPYPSPLHRSPSGASVMAMSPRPDVSPKSAAYPAINGQIRVGFYQDTVSSKSSPDKSCSPKKSPYGHGQYSEHLYTPNAAESSYYSYPNSPYYTHQASYSSINPTRPYNLESGQSYYDTSKSLTDQYHQAKSYSANSPQQSPVGHTKCSPVHNLDSVHQHSPGIPNSPSVHSSVPSSPSLHNSPAFNPNSPKFHPNSPIVHSDSTIIHHNSLIVHPSSSNIHPHSPNLHQNPPILHEVHSPVHNSPSVHHSSSSLHPNSPGFNPNLLNRHQNPPGSMPSKHSPILLSRAPQNQTQSPIYSMPIHSRLSPGIPSQQQNASAAVQAVHSNQPTGVLQNQTYREPAAEKKNPPEKHPHSQSVMFPVKKRAYSELESQQLQAQRYEGLRSAPYEKEVHKAYVHQNIPVPDQSKSNLSAIQSLHNLQKDGPRNVSYSNSNPYVGGAYEDQAYHLNIPSAGGAAAARGKVDLSKYTNMGYTGPEALQQIGYKPADQQGQNFDRFGSDECMISNLQSSPSYYSDKGLGSAHMFNKSMTTSASGLTMFGQANVAGMATFGQNVQQQVSNYSRQIQELQSNAALMLNEAKGNAPATQPPEKKAKKRKSSKSAVADQQSSSSSSNQQQQGFQSYAGLKGSSAPPLEPGAISLKTSSVVPGSAFKFGPTPPLGLYGDKDAFPSYLDDFRPGAPNYYQMAHAGPRPAYPIGAPFMPNAQAQLMDTGSPLYQHYLQQVQQAGVLNQGLLGPPGPYLAMRQPYDPMSRPSWI